MPDHTSTGIANEFLKLRNSDTMPVQMQLQKLVYIAHGWNLAINNQPLVDELPEAWDNGPVFRSLWNHIKSAGFHKQRLCSIWDDEPVFEKINEEEEKVIQHVWRKYGHKTGAALSAMTHQIGTPWTKTYFEKGRNIPIQNDLIREHYVALAMAGREQS